MTDFTDLTESLQFAWFCGLFEGEGWITRPNQRSGRKSVRVAVASTDKDVLDRICIIADCGKVYTSACPYASLGLTYEKLGHKPKWEWRVGSWIEVEPLIRRMRPFMCERRRDKIDEILADPPALVGGAKRKDFCIREHDLNDPSNVRFKKDRYGNNVRVCVKCEMIRQRERRARIDQGTANVGIAL